MSALRKGDVVLRDGQERVVCEVRCDEYTSIAVGMVSVLVLTARLTLLRRPMRVGDALVHTDGTICAVSVANVAHAHEVAEGWRHADGTAIDHPQLTAPEAKIDVLSAKGDAWAAFGFAMRPGETTIYATAQDIREAAFERSEAEVAKYARAIFDWEHSDEAAERGEAWASPPERRNGFTVRVARDDFDARMLRALDVMWTTTKREDAAKAMHRAHGMMEMLKRRAVSS